MILFYTDRLDYIIHQIRKYNIGKQIFEHNGIKYDLEDASWMYAEIGKKPIYRKRFETTTLNVMDNVKKEILKRTKYTLKCFKSEYKNYQNEKKINYSNDILNKLKEAAK